MLTRPSDPSAPIVAGLFDMLDMELPRLSGKSRLAEASRYALHRRAVFGRFLEDGRIEIDSNIVERAIRPQAILRKNVSGAASTPSLVWAEGAV